MIFLQMSPIQHQFCLVSSLLEQEFHVLSYNLEYNLLLETFSHICKLMFGTGTSKNFCRMYDTSYKNCNLVYVLRSIQEHALL